MKEQYWDLFGTLHNIYDGKLAKLVNRKKLKNNSVKDDIKVLVTPHEVIRKMST